MKLIYKCFNRRCVALAMATILLLTLFWGIKGANQVVNAAETTNNRLENGGFETGDLSGWTDADAEFAISNNANSGNYGMSVSQDGVGSSQIRTDVMSVGAETDYTLSWFVNTTVYLNVKAIVYEYSFNNKIVDMHEYTFYGPTDGWKKVEFSFTTTVAVDNMGVVFEINGAHGVAYIDDVLLVATEAEKAQPSYDDSNGDDSFDVKDIVRMQRVLEGDTSVALAVSKYADRNGDGKFTADDTAALRRKLVGVADDFTGVMATNGDIGAFGAKLQNTAAGVTPYLTTGKSYTDETFTFTAMMEQFSLAVGVRVPNAHNLNQDKQGIVIGIYEGFVEFYGGSLFANPIGAVGFSGGTLTSGEMYVFSVRMTNNEDGTRTMYFEARQDSKLKAYFTYTFTTSDTYAGTSGIDSVSYIPESGEFVVWMRAYAAADECQDVLYQVIETETQPNVVVKENGHDGVGVLTLPESSGYWEGAYLAMDGNYTNERFAFTTTIADAASPNLMIGSHMQGLSSNAAAYDGIVIRLYGGFYEVYQTKGGNVPYISDNYYADSLALTSGQEYTFIVETTCVDGHTMLQFEVLQGEVLIHTAIYQSENEGIPASGNFMVWSQDAERQVAWQMPQTNTETVVVEGICVNSTALLAGESPYMITLESYEEEYFEFTTIITDGANPNLTLGAHMSGVDVNAGTGNGLIIKFYENFYEVYAPSLSSENIIAAQNLMLESGKEYTFGISVSGTESFTLRVEQGNTVVHSYTGVVPEEKEILESGHFMVWSTDASRFMEYAIVDAQKLGTSIVVPKNGIADTVYLHAPLNLSAENLAYLALDGTYTTETFEFTTVIEDVKNPNLLIGAHMAGVDSNPSTYNGFTLRFHEGFFEAFGTTYLDYTVYQADTLALSANVKYTFSIWVMDKKTIHLNVTSSAGTVYDKDIVFDTEVIPASGSFMVWSQDANRQVSYKMPQMIARNTPDYSTSNLALDMYAFIPPSNGLYMDENGVWHEDGTDYRYIVDEEGVPIYLKQYKDCGFDTYLMNGYDSYDPGHIAYVNKLFEYCAMVDLDVIVHDQLLFDMANQETSLIGTEFVIGDQKYYYENETELQNAIAERISGYSHYENFKGVTIDDEPSHASFQAHAEIMKALRTVAPDIYIHTVLLPYDQSSSFYTQYTGEQYVEGSSMEEAYATYVGNYLETTGESILSVDCYPILREGEGTTINKIYFYTLQAMVQEAASRNANAFLTVQSVGSDFMADPTESDIRFQLNAALGFGIKDIRYYTYWAFPNYTISHTSSIIGKDGEKILYDEVQRANADAQKLAKVILNFDYVKSQVFGDVIGGELLNTGMLDDISVTSYSQPTIVNQLRDDTGNNNGYMILNASVPREGMDDEVVLNFDGYNFATYYVKGEPKTVRLTENVLTLDIASGDGVLVVPHN